MLWDLAEGKRLYSLDAGDIIHSLTFSPNRYWLCAATQSSIKIWDLERCGLPFTLTTLLSTTELNLQFILEWMSLLSKIVQL